MGVKENYDFCGWATKNGIKCADGKIICQNAFSTQDGTQVPLVWAHIHDDPDMVLGHAILENRPEGVYAYGYFNDSPKAKSAKHALQNGDYNSLSIWANDLIVNNGCEVSHGVIRDLSLVLGGKNPGAFVESVIAHGMSIEEDDIYGIVYTGEPVIIHSNEPEKKNDKGGSKMDGDNNSGSGKTAREVLSTLDEEQKQAVAILIASFIEDDDDNDDNNGGGDVKHNVFEGELEGANGADKQVAYLSHGDLETIYNLGKRCGSMREGMKLFMEEKGISSGVLMHGLDTEGMQVVSADSGVTYGVKKDDMLLPDYKATSTTPTFISRDMGWVSHIMGKVHHTPFARIKSLFADITEEEARAKGYIKGKEKKEEVFSILKRTTEPQTIYKKQKLDRDDIIDTTDFDLLAWIKGEMQIMYLEEQALAILLGDGRLKDSDDKIKEDKIRPIVSDVPLFNTTVIVDQGESESDSDYYARLIDEIVRAHKKYKGSGRPDFYTTEDILTEMLLQKNKIGERIYKTETELSTTLRASEIVTVEPMDGRELEYKDQKYNILGVLVNVADYNVGADKGGSKSLFEDFDIDFNQQKFLLEGRMSGALVKPFSAVTFLRKVKN